MSKIGGRNFSLIVISAIKFLKCAIFLGLALGLLSLSKLSPDDLSDALSADLHVDVLNRYWDAISNIIQEMTPFKIRLAEVGFSAYFLLNLAQGIGLLFRWKWAAFLTVVDEIFFIPFEIYGMFTRFTMGLFGVFCIHSFIAIYLLKNWFLFGSRTPAESLGGETEES